MTPTADTGLPNVSENLPDVLNLDTSRSSDLGTGPNSDVGCRETSAQSLVPLELFVQGNSNTTFLMLTEPGAIRDFDLVKTLWSTVLLHLSELECRLLQQSDECSEAFDALVLEPHNCDYLIYSPQTTQLTGNMMNPLTCEEHEFCQHALGFHEEFLQSPEIRSKVIHCQGNLFGAVRRDDQQTLFYRSSESPHLPCSPFSGNSASLGNIADRFLAASKSA